VPWPDNSVGRRRLITIPAGKVSEDLPDFRLLVSLAGDSGVKLAEADGRDIFFTAGDGVTLHDYEIERIDTAQGMLDAWVRIPLLKASKDNHLYLYYDDPSASDRQNAAGVWKGCAGVWHLSDSPTAPPPQVQDSTSNAIHGTVTGAPEAAEGVVAGAIQLKQSGDRVELGDHDALDFGTDPFTYSVWVLADPGNGQWDAPWFKGGADDSVAGYDIQLGTGPWGALVSDGVNAETTAASFGAESEFLGRWVYLVAVVDRAAGLLRAYADGMPRKTADITAVGSLSSSFPARIGDTLGGAPFSGRIDEVRVCSGALPASAVAGMMASTSTPATFHLVGSEETAP
jgi:hypothetical protein